MELERALPALAREGLKAAAVSYDGVGALRDFATRRAITFPLLSDPDSQIIRAFGLLNVSLAKDSPIYGVPYPGLIVVDERGVIKDRFFEDDYRERDTVGGILLSRFGVNPGLASSQAQTPQLTLNASASAASIRGGQRLTLALDIELNQGFHVYAPGVQADYIPARWDLPASEGWKLHDPVFPPAKTMTLLGDQVPVWEGRFRITRDLTVANERALRKLLGDSQDIVIQGSFRYQACNDRECFPPKTLPLEWRIRLEPHDSQRVPAELRRLK